MELYLHWVEFICIDFPSEDDVISSQCYCLIKSCSDYFVVLDNMLIPDKKSFHLIVDNFSIRINYKDTF